MFIISVVFIGMYYCSTSVNKYFTFSLCDYGTFSEYQKSDKASIYFCNLGNKALEKNTHESLLSSVHCFKLAILFATAGSREVTIAYSKKSLAMEALGLKMEALKDIDLAITTGSPLSAVQMNKIEEMRDKLLTELNDQSFDPTFENMFNANLTAMNDFYEEMFTLKSPNPLVPSLEKFAYVRRSPDHGKQIIVTQNIPIGATILVERPFVSVLLNALNWDVDHCHHCFRKTWNAIPCKTCVFTLYCSSRCQTNGYRYHKYECPCLPDLHCNLSDANRTNFHLAFKLICQMGPQKLFEMYNQQKDNKPGDWQLDINDNDTKWNLAECDPDTGIYASDSYRAFYNLQARVNPQELVHSILYSLILAYTLDLTSNLCTSIPPKAKTREKFRDFVAQLILHHYQTFAINAFKQGFIDWGDITLRTLMNSEAPFQDNVKDIIKEKSKTDAKDKPKDKVEREPSRALNYNLTEVIASVYTTGSLINHSCSPNVMSFVGKRFGTIAYVALRPLVDGQELFISYGPNYGNLSDALQLPDKKTRRKELWNSFGFICDCVACKYDWPPYETLVNKQPSFCCPLCSQDFRFEVKMSDEFLKRYKLSREFKCKGCQFSYSEAYSETEYKNFSEVLRASGQLLEGNFAVKAFTDAKNALTYFAHSVCPPVYNSAVFGPAVFRNAVNHIIYFADRDVNSMVADFS